MITAREKFQCVERELGYRHFVYPRRIANGQMSQKLADRQIEIMAAIVEDYRVLAEKEDREGRLL